MKVLIIGHFDGFQKYQHLSENKLISESFFKDERLIYI